ncbi:hypothetical protein CLV63_11114 [Murinocardiopsis flavida]|uniref:Gram-positive cocci surface proteins LPxTG domain-containing protein n=1 Tax=Murinocardiopsis flavida TaxID=645275 RepID=A0A2P8DGR6_9ACTN|nr:hypothetical protein [Murinocardiopsis flavida]PSK96420.1 hypothetical protein CLV63_11114 [Murinocardiopsis flavida]
MGTERESGAAVAARGGRRRKALPVAGAAALIIAALIAVSQATGAAAPPDPYAESTWAALELPADVYGPNAVSGRYGHIQADADTGGYLDADFTADPDGIAPYLPAALRQAQISIHTGSGESATARATLTNLTFRVPAPAKGGAAEVITQGGTPAGGLYRVMDVANVQNYVQCNPPAAPIVQANTNADAITVFGNPVAVDGTTAFEVPGNYSGDTDTVRVTVNARYIREVAGQQARIRIVLDVSAEALRADGSVADQAQLYALTLGDVYVDCDGTPPVDPTPTPDPDPDPDPDPSPSTSPSPSASPSASPTPRPRPSPSFSPRPRPSPSPSPSASPSPSVSPSPSPSGSASPSPTESPSPSTGPEPDGSGPVDGDGDSGGLLPVTGMDLAALLGMAVVVLGGGAALVVLARRGNG